MNKLVLILCLLNQCATAGDDDLPVGTLSLITGPTPAGWVDPASVIPCAVYRELCGAIYPGEHVAEIDLSRVLPAPPEGMGHWVLKAN